MKKFRLSIVFSVLFSVLSISMSFAQLIPVEIDLSRQKPTFPFAPIPLPNVVSDASSINANAPASVELMNGKQVTGQIKFIAGSNSNFINTITIQDAVSGEKHKLKFADIKTLTVALEKNIKVSEVSSFDEARRDLNNRAGEIALELLRGQKIAHFEKVTIKGKKDKETLLQVINVNGYDRERVTIYMDPKTNISQAKVSLQVKEPGYSFKGAVMENIPDSYYVRNNNSSETYYVSKKDYKKSGGQYDANIFSNVELIERLKAGNEAAVINYKADNWAFFFMNAVYYNRVQ